ncbi:MAG TPA: XRE family transcriptional regulator [Amycolatopsis sp.]|uniref:ImmA/IrrE family metallo-endopeptidase n=1 Tax=Amycolatopsis sp. TaxID=37632 RepID=UPI002B46DDD2|nr:XRE family transcriptional regulator [Amycolatopsis sp.]HKS46384.1 XRE family transcriptional regulator [Amycolatopsis sp.]
MAETIGDAAVPRMLVLARESRGLTQKQLSTSMSELAGGATTSQGFVSRAEAGQLPVSGERLELYAEALGYPSSLLRTNKPEFGAGVGLVHHRKRQLTTAGDIKRIHAVLNLTRLQVRSLMADVPARTTVPIPHVEVDDLTTPADAARAVRAAIGATAGPLESAVQLLEHAGALVLSRELLTPAQVDAGTETVPVDAVSCCPAGEDPLVLLNTGTPAERQRYTLAHELGHMVMHQVPHKDQEKQANAFAAELLMPATLVRTDLSGGQLGIPRLLELKKQWNVSMWALLRRAHTLGILSDWRYRSLAVEMSTLGYRTNEPDELPPDTPAAVEAAIAWHLRHGRTIDDLAARAGLHVQEFTRLYLAASPTSTSPDLAADPVSPFPSPVRTHHDR